MKYSQFFETKNNRTENKLFTCCTDNTPDSLKALIQAIHSDFFGNCLPNDWIYQTIREAFEALEEDELENCTIESDIYNSELTLWLHENGNAFAIEACEEAMEALPNKPYTLLKIIGEAQFLAKHRIYHAVNDFMVEQCK